ncbi:MAG: response regulator [Candidatus Marithrix sp.]
MNSKVLIVDDQEAMRDALIGILKNQGYELFTAVNGEEALIQAENILPDIILLDVMMPEMDGFEVCQCVRANPILAKVPVVMVTALDDHDSRLRGIKAGADDFVSKPYNIFELRARVKTITNLNRYQRLITEQSKFKWMIENTGEAYVMLNADKQITYANTKACLYLNYSDDIKENFVQLIAKSYYQVHEKSAEPEPINIELNKIPCYIVRPDTKTSLPFWLRVDVMEMPEDTTYLIHLHDVTDTILMDRQKWVFSGQIGHKLRTPLTPIIGGIDFMLQNLAELPITKIKGFLEMAYEGATRLNNQIEEILNYMRASNTTKVYEPCNMPTILASIKVVKKLLEIESVLIIQPDDTSDDYNIAISKQVLEIILTEIFSNAKKFHPTEKPNIEIKLSKESETIIVQISDDGLSIPSEQLGDIWMPYYQGEKYFTGEMKGMGLGLAMVASLIWEIGGTCTAYNQADKNGLTIEFTLPITYPAQYNVIDEI